ncbi:MAG: hypothetical protein ACJA1A_001991 [Saprospiraceae bacterium]|jgi:hypothetical protein
MNKLFSLLVVLFIAASANAQVDAIDRFFETYQDDDAFTMVYVSPKMFKMFAKVAGDELDTELQNLVKDLKGLKILRTDKDAVAVYKSAIKKIPTNEYELLMTARDDGQNVKILTKSKGDDVIEELLLLVGGANEFILVSFVGNINLNDLAKVASSLDIEGMKHLEKLGND